MSFLNCLRWLARGFILAWLDDDALRAAIHSRNSSDGQSIFVEDVYRHVYTLVAR